MSKNSAGLRLPLESQCLGPPEGGVNAYFTVAEFSASPSWHSRPLIWLLESRKFLLCFQCHLWETGFKQITPSVIHYHPPFHLFPALRPSHPFSLWNINISISWTRKQNSDRWSLTHTNHLALLLPEIRHIPSFHNSVPFDVHWFMQTLEKPKFSLHFWMISSLFKGSVTARCTAQRPIFIFQISVSLSREKGCCL